VIARLEAAPAADDWGLAHGLAGTVAWLARVDPARARRFAAPLLDVERAPERLAWCRGDLGIACALWSAGLADQALALAHASARRPEATTGVIDPGLCHGAAGVGHLFARLAHASGDATLRDAARDWHRRALAMPFPDDGDLGLMRGISGVALALLAAASDEEPSWDRLFLVDLPSDP
jgi:lantibiotic biosynthesis protein